MVMFSRTTHLNGSKSIEDGWKDVTLTNRVMDEKWTGKTIFIEEIPISSVSSMDVDEYLDFDFENNKETWDQMELDSVSAVNTEPFDLPMKISTTNSESQGGTELDSHADSPVVGSNCFIKRKTGKKVNVSGFSDELGKPMSVDVVDAVVAYDDPLEGDTYLSVIKNALHVPSMKSNLIPPFMMRLAGIEVNECPKFLSEFPTIKNHSILFREENVRIPLQLSNTISLIPTRTPSQDEISLIGTPDIRVMHLTPDSPSWNSHNNSYETQEYDMVDSYGLWEYYSS